jgi:hypothetical protein
MQHRLWLTTSALVVALEAVLSPPTLVSAVHVSLLDVHTRLGADGPAGELAATSLLTAVVGVAAWLCAAWLALLCVLDVLGNAPGRLGAAAERLRAVLTPRLVARLLYSGLAATSALGIASPALAAGSTSTLGSAIASPAAPCTQDPLPNLDRPAPPIPCVHPPTGTATNLGAGAPYIVHAGDTLWSVAAAELAAAQRVRPTSSAIAARWPAWWQANRNEIGGDPALLLPGEHLTAPSPAP